MLKGKKSQGTVFFWFTVAVFVYEKKGKG